MAARGAAPRAAAARWLAGVLEGRSLAAGPPRAVEALAPADRALAQELVYGTLRFLPRLEWRLGRLLERPLARRATALRALLLLGLYQVGEGGFPAHAAVHATVAAAAGAGAARARGLVNAVLRRWLRERGALAAAEAEVPEARWAHPAWLIEAVRRDWPQRWQAVLEAGNRRPPMTLRVALDRIGREQARALLAEAGVASEPVLAVPSALVLAEPVPVERLPGFAEGLVSVQDAAAQLAAPLLEPPPGGRVLDACAAPGGKTGHLLELVRGEAEVVALDSDARRIERLRATLARLRREATVRTGDARAPAGWWDGRPFARILLDAPCSGTGVLRRQPDIKLHRRAADVPALARTQAAMLEALWPLLEPGGMLLYVTCSLLRAENEAVAGAFLAAHADAEEAPIEAPWGHACRVGRQVLTGEGDMDGFYFARLRKRGGARG